MDSMEIDDCKKSIKEWAEDQYHCGSQRRGVAVIIINLSAESYMVERKGWECDRDNLQKMFSHLGFEVRTFVDMGLKDVKCQLEAISREDHSKCDCFALALSSHGYESYDMNVREDTIIFKDGTIPTRKILGYFNDNACPSLAGKPKLFFLQACRGDKRDDGVQMKVHGKEEKPTNMQEVGSMFSQIQVKRQPVIRQASDQHDAVPMVARHRSTAIKPQVIPNAHHYTGIASLQHRPDTTRTTRIAWETTCSDVPLKPAPCEEDFLVMYATPPGYYAFRRPTEGSWFIKALSDILTPSNKLSVTRQLTRVIGTVAQIFTSKSSDAEYDQKKQSPVLYSMLTKDVYFPEKMQTE